MAQQWSNTIFSGSLSTTASSVVVDSRGYKAAFLQVFSPVGGAVATFTLKGTSATTNMTSVSGVAGQMDPLALYNIASGTTVPGTFVVALSGTSPVIPFATDFLRVDLNRTGGSVSDVVVILTLQD